MAELAVQAKGTGAAMPGLAGNKSRALVRQEYDFLRQGLYRIGRDAGDRERLFVKVIAEHVGRLHKALYPHPVLRALHQFKTWLIDRPVHLRVFREQRAANLGQLKAQLHGLGFAPLTGRIEKQLDYESTSMRVAATAQLSGEARVDYSLQFEKDGLGAYRLTGFDAVLNRPGEASRGYRFETQLGVTAPEAANLLEGRPVKKGLETADGSVAFKWLQLDFREREKGLLREYQPGYAYDLKSELQQLAVLLALPTLAKKEVIQNLEMGNVAGFSVRDKGPFYMQADPAQGLKIFDMGKRTVEIPELQKLARQPERAKTIQLVKSPGQDKARGLGY